MNTVKGITGWLWSVHISPLVQNHLSGSLLNMNAGNDNRLADRVFCEARLKNCKQVNEIRNGVTTPTKQ